MKINFAEIFAVTAPGLEEVCAAEIRNLLGCAVSITRGGVSFSGGLEELYLANLWLRTASRVLVRIGKVRATDFPQLHRKVKHLPWGRFIKTDTPVIVNAVSRRSRLIHTDRIADTVSAAIGKSLGRATPPPAGDAQTVLVRFEDDNCLLSVDSSGELLHRRGYRTEVSQAPLRETLAAGILHLLKWDGQRPLADPMCGSGTFLIEGALLAGNIPPGLRRTFAFQRWPRYRDGLWQNLVDKAGRDRKEIHIPLVGCDRDGDVIKMARNNAARVKQQGIIGFKHAALEEFMPSAKAGLVVCNPPYGVRLGDEKGLLDLYARMGQTFREHFAGWQGALFCPSDHLVAATGLDFRVAAQLANGGIEAKLFVCQL
ncbi:MAG: class I SAM-dependent RNA methyltransferase [Desulfuromonas sp.]|nr:MAG: class I SAM-dependent RNA methyltransferase [Desulfuromonas sp.]